MTAKRIDPKQANALMAQGWVYVDVRTEAEFAGGHPKGALNVPLSSPDFLAVMQKLFKPDSKLIVGCQMGGRSARACMLLASHGFLELADQSPGWAGQRDGLGRVVEAGWLEAKLPIGDGVTYTELVNRK